MISTCRCLLVLILCSLVFLISGQVWKSSTEKELTRDLIKRYEKDGTAGRPVARATDTVRVKFGLSLVQILEVDEKKQVLQTNMWYYYKWRDVLLQWEPLARDNITSIRVPSDQIWVPDILLYNFADDRLMEQRQALAVVSHTGHLVWKPQAILNSSCTFNILFFPFDQQICHLKFGSWTYDGSMLDIDFIDGQNKLDLTNYIQSNEWELVGNSGARNVKFYACCSDPFPDLTFTLKLRRKITFYTFILILPCGLLSLLTLVTFWVPPASSAKLQLGMNIFMAFFVLLSVLADLTPTAATSIPLIGAFYCLSMVMITMSTVLACVTANMYFRGIRIDRPPRWLRSGVLHGAARILGMEAGLRDTYQHKKAWSTYVTSTRNPSDPTHTVSEVHLLDRSARGIHDTGDYGTFQDVSAHVFTSLSSTSSSRTTGASTTTNQEAMLVEEVAHIRGLMNLEVARRKSQEENNKHIQEWRMMSGVMDRFFFFFYVIVSLVGVTCIFLQSYLSYTS